MAKCGGPAETERGGPSAKAQGGRAPCARRIRTQTTIAVRPFRRTALFINAAPIKYEVVLVATEGVNNQAAARSRFYGTGVSRQASRSIYQLKNRPYPQCGHITQGTASHSNTEVKWLERGLYFHPGHGRRLLVAAFTSFAFLCSYFWAMASSGVSASLKLEDLFLSLCVSATRQKQSEFEKRKKM